MDEDRSDGPLLLGDRRVIDRRCADRCAVPQPNTDDRIVHCVLIRVVPRGLFQKLCSILRLPERQRDRPRG